MFDAKSRYATVAEAVYVTEDGREILYKRLRRTPELAVFRVHRVARGDRLDRLAFTYFQDSEQFWRLADANGALRPEELTAELGRRLGVPLARE